MPSDERQLAHAVRHIERIKEGTYPAVVGRDSNYRIVERDWKDMPEPSKLAILQDAVDWSGISNRDQGHILLSEIDPGKISDTQRNRLIDMAVSEDGYQEMLEEKAAAATGRGKDREKER
ncbi:hypothetical protein [Paludisphaera mucosa]|uniref:Uncharacterized protein n=1 Tax=Paludisphaera mucosa TaxID=3030827 RepID=A0ABT6FGB2_9BACT|nr:hypothetical protein [Paludisphaera mucosa]MDG3006448.1 hypothetical protein [Paludisphaera mucosa]